MLFINNNIYKKWNLNVISSHSNITIQDIINNPDKPWNWGIISYNKFTIYKPKQLQIVKWYKRMKLIHKLYLAIEVMVIEQMKPDGKYIQTLIKDF